MPICLVRILGQTFLSSYVVLLLDSLNKQLEKCLGIKEEDSCMWCTGKNISRNLRNDLLTKVPEFKTVIRSF